MKHTLLLLTLGLVGVASAQAPKADVEAIKSMCGCYEVEFHFAETFPFDTTYEKHEDYHAGPVVEYIHLVEESPKKLVLQHLLIVHDTMLVKHWRQDWEFENTTFYDYHLPNHWTYVTRPTKEVKGQWTQKVFEVNDAPRYQASATWVHQDGRHYWESTTDAPLPRREYTHRSDYNVMTRTNRHEMTAGGHIHDQQNIKIVREGAQDKPLVREAGWNTYTKVEGAKCQLAKDWWTENQSFWAQVRAAWADVFATKKDLVMEHELDGRPFWKALHALEKELTERKAKPEEVRKQVRALIDRYRKIEG